MNKLICISTVIIGLTLASCSKQDITPINNDPVEVPSWEVQKSTIIDSGIADDLDDSEEGSTGDITDPNNDPDGKTKGK